MPLDERAKEYGNRLLGKNRKQIDSNFKTRTEQVIKQSTPPGSVLPGLMLRGFIDALIEQIRQLGTAKMESLLTAYGDGGRGWILSEHHGMILLQGVALRFRVQS